MTYNVSSGTLNTTIPFQYPDHHLRHLVFDKRKVSIKLSPKSCLYFQLRYYFRNLPAEFCGIVSEIIIFFYLQFSFFIPPTKEEENAFARVLCVCFFLFFDAIHLEPSRNFLVESLDKFENGCMAGRDLTYLTFWILLL